MIMHCRRLSSSVVFLFVLGLCSTHAWAKSLSFDLFADIATQSSMDRLNVTDAVSYQGNLYFTAHDLETGHELWIKSPGSTPEILMDILPGPDDSSPGEFSVVGQFLYFLATDSSGARKLWKMDANKQIGEVEIEHPQGTPVSIRGYYVSDQGIYLLESPPQNTIQISRLWHYSAGESLSLIDDTIAQTFNYSDVANLFIFQGDLFLFLYSDQEFDHCLLRRYPAAVSSNSASDIECDALAYDHQMQVVNNTVYFKGKQHLLAFDGEMAPRPVLDGNAPTGNIEKLGDALYVVTNNFSEGYFNQQDEMPYVYRIDDSGMSVVMAPSDRNSEQATIDIEIAAYDEQLVIAEGAGYWDGKTWVGIYNRLYTLNPETGFIDILAKLNGYQNYIRDLTLLNADGDTLCVAGVVGYYHSLFCLDALGELSLQMETTPGNSEPAFLTVLNEDVFFNARQDGQWGLWKSNRQQNLEFVQPGFFEGLTAWHSQLFFQKGSGDLYRLDDHSNVVFINETVPGFPQKVTQISYGKDAIYLLSEDSGKFEIWGFDGENSPDLVVQASLKAGLPKITLVDNDIFLSLSRRYGPLDDSEQCAVYRVTQGDLVLQANHSTDQGDRCKSRIYETEGMVFVYFEYYLQNVLHSSLVQLSGTSDEPELSWWWQGKQLQIMSGPAFFHRENALYFCSRAKNINGHNVDLLRVTPDWQPIIVDDMCLDDIVVSDFSGSDQVYGLTTAKNGLYQVNDFALEKVTGSNGVYVGHVAEAIEYKGSLLLSSRFRDSSFSYGHELVKVSVINDHVQFILDDTQEVNLLMEANSGSFSFTSNLLVTEIDEADMVVWGVMTKPRNGSIDGLPYQVESDGLALQPEAVIYQPNLGFIGHDNFEIIVTDGFSESTLQFNITVSQTNSETTIVDTQRSSGGTMGWLLVFILVTTRRLMNYSVCRP